MKPQAKYISLLERELEYLRELLGQARKDLEFYRAKVERLELALMKDKAFAFDLSPEKVSGITETKFEKAPHRLPFSEVKRQWNQLTAQQQEKAIADGWDLESPPEVKKEEVDEGKQHV